ncbi:MAG: FAD synthetase family protein [Rikenellaceae bacterium]
MNIFYNFDYKFHNAVVVVGSFDGVHKGHRQLIEELNSEADRIEGDAVVITFDPHPRDVFGRPNNLLTNIEERIDMLEEAGVRNLVIVNFSLEFAAVSASEFATEYLRERIGAVCVFTGAGHTFGRNKEGESTQYSKFGLREISIQRTLPISSTMVRERVLKGDMLGACELLGSKSGYLVITPVVTPNKLLPPTFQQLECVVDGQKMSLTAKEIKEYNKEGKIYIQK